MRNILKNIYLIIRKYFLNALAFIIHSEKLSGVKSRHGIHKILYIRIDRIGDLVLSTPAFKALKDGFPDSEVTVLTSQVNKSIILKNPFIDRIIVYDRKFSLREKIKTIKELRKHGFDLVIDPYSDYELKSAMIAFLSVSKLRLGYASYGREVFFNLTGPPFEKNDHFVHLTLNVLKPLGIEIKDRRPEIFLTEDEKEWAKRWLKEKGLGGKAIIGLHPGANYDTQRWPKDRYAELIRLLIEDGRSDPVLFGGPDDETRAREIESIVNNNLTKYIARDLRQFLALLSCCSTLICNNSGPLHMAVALGIPTVSFMGPTDKSRWMPVGDIHKVFRMDNLPCIGCKLGECKIGTHDCMRLITPDMVIKAVDSMIPL